MVYLKSYPWPLHIFHHLGSSWEYCYSVHHLFQKVIGQLLMFFHYGSCWLNFANFPFKLGLYDYHIYCAIRYGNFVSNQHQSSRFQRVPLAHLKLFDLTMVFWSFGCFSIAILGWILTQGLPQPIHADTHGDIDSQDFASLGWTDYQTMGSILVQETSQNLDLQATVRFYVVQGHQYFLNHLSCLECSCWLLGLWQLEVDSSFIEGKIYEWVHNRVHHDTDCWADHIVENSNCWNPRSFNPFQYFY